MKALASYETAARLYPSSLMPLINSSVLYSYTGNHSKAEENLKKALQFDPVNEAANLNLGLLLAETGKLQEAEKALAAALQANPKQAVAAYNLSVIVSQHNIEKAVHYAKIAADARADEPKYAYTLAYYQLQNKQQSEAEKTLEALIARHPLYLNAVSFLADLYMKENRLKDLKLLYEQVIKIEGIPEQDKKAMMQALTTIGSQR
jgi:tetratricopeptide (TPR) repeat protein